MSVEVVDIHQDVRSELPRARQGDPFQPRGGGASHEDVSEPDDSAQ